jgi:diacylglycerol kinase family enzyme
MLHYVYLINRFQLHNKCDELMEKLREVSEELGRDYEFVISETPEEAQKALAGFRDKDYVITAIGGDGSINHVLNAIVGTKNILSFIPFGTGNDFCRTCVESMENGIHEVDIIRVNDRYCINVACFGIDADMANDDLFIHSKWIPRTMRFNASVVGHFLRYKKGRRLRIECKGKVREGYFATVIAANCRYYGSGYNVSPKSVTDDGMMEIFEVGSLPRIPLAMLILKMKKARHLGSKGLKNYRTRSLVVSSDQPFKANLDGEPYLSDRFELEVIPKGIRLDVHKDVILRGRV